jgi:hypothetical protein
MGKVTGSLFQKERNSTFYDLFVPSLSQSCGCVETVSFKSMVHLNRVTET